MPDENDELPGEREQIDAIRRQMQAGAFRPEADGKGNVEEGGYVDRAKGVRLIDPTDRFVFEHQANGDIHVLDTKQYGEDGGSALAPEGGEPQDDDQRDDHPFAISVGATAFGLSGEAVQWRIQVLGGTYATGDGAPFAVTGGDYPAVVLDENQHRNPGVGELPIKTVVILFVPVEPANEGETGAVKCSDGRYAKAKAGGQVATFGYLPAVFPVRVNNPTLGPGFVVHLGTWTSRYAEQDVGGTPTRQNRVSINQLVTDDVVLDEESDADPVARTFFCTGSGANVIVSAGAINNKPVAETTLTPSDGHSVYIEATVNGSGDTTAVTVASAASVPANTTTKGYTLLATVAVSAGVATPTPLAWNYSQMQKCGSTTYLWGGFGE